MLMNKVFSSSIILLSVAAQATLVSGFTGFSPSASLATSRSYVLQQSVISADTDTKTTPKISNDEERNNIAEKLLTTCATYGQVGSKLTEEERSIIDDIAASLGSSSSPSPAKIELSGKHELIYSASPSASSGALGPLTGKVTQSFLDEIMFINRVEFFAGAFKIELYAERKVLDDTRIRVKFKETVISVLGKEVKRFEAKGSGIWDYVFAGSITKPSGEKMLLRVMKTPSTFVIVQRE
mmetsp:Transcript_24999/g.38346  ORF Transcript_24999/g.38346 Transcript_24999/m.38346 type:complete len:239 (+) Transcript_24999:45-761(+)